MVDYIELAIPILERNKSQGYHVKQLAQTLLDEHPNLKDSLEDIAIILNKKFYSDVQKKTGAQFAKVKNKNGKFKRGVYRLKQTKKPPIKTEAIKAPVNVGTQFTGSGGEHAVLAELLFRGYNAGIMTVDEGIDIVASKDNRYHHIQVKTAYESNGSFTFTIKNKAFQQHTGAAIFYIFICRRNDGGQLKNSFIVLPSFAIEFYLANEALKPNSNSIHLGVKVIGRKFILAGREDVSTYIDAFHLVK